MLARLRRSREERGAVAILVAVLAIVLMMCAALSVDIGMQVNRKQQLWASLDSAAQAGAASLPGSTATAYTAALAYAKSHDYTETGSDIPTVDFWCVVGATGSSAPYTVDTTQIPASCNPGAGPYTVNSNYGTTGRKITCSAVLCAIPCVQPTTNNTAKIACNTIRVYQGRDVPFSFARAGGFQKGNTGALVSVACKGPCGTVAPNPMNVTVVADRTGSMESADLLDMVNGIKGMLQVMTPSQQYVSLGTIGRSSGQRNQTDGSCASGHLTYPGSDVANGGAFIPMGFSSNYLNSDGTINTGSGLVKGVDCLYSSRSKVTGGTALAAPMKAAARYLLDTDANNLPDPDPRTGSTPQKVLIFETDGQPNEQPTTQGSTDLSSSSEPFSNYADVTTTRVGTSNTYTVVPYGGNNACDNLLQVAQEAKNAGILVIVIGYNMTYSSSSAYSGWKKTCTDYDAAGLGGDSYPDIRSQSWQYQVQTGSGWNTTTKTYNVTKEQPLRYVSTVLAQAASPMQDGTPSAAQNTCSTDADRQAENSDGDYFFCAASGDDMAPIFKTALSQAQKGIKLMNLPGS